MTKSIMIVGVGGQGTLLTSRILGELFVRKGYDVKVSEVHGLSQRGGSVVTYVRFGEKVYSPIVDKGEADFILSFECLESARYLEYLKEDGEIISNIQKINPMSVIVGDVEYPNELLQEIKEKGIKINTIDTIKIAQDLGNDKVANVVLLGAFSKYFDFEKEDWINVIEDVVKKDFIELNIKAFEKGLEIE